MAEPTKEQIQWLWEQIFGKDGVEFGETIFERKLVCYRRTRWIEADEEYNIEVIPDTDSLEFMGFLFKYVVPKVCVIELYSYNGRFCWTVETTDCSYDFADDDPALALFWAIYKALGGK